MRWIRRVNRALEVRIVRWKMKITVKKREVVGMRAKSGVNSKTPTMRCSMSTSSS